MSDPGNTPRLDPDVAGQDRAPEAQRETAVGGWFKVGALVWIVVIVVAVVFIVAIITAAR